MSAARKSKQIQIGMDQSLQDKKIVEVLRQRLNEKLQNPEMAKKAALILESWLNQKRK